MEGGGVVEVPVAGKGVLLGLGFAEDFGQELTLAGFGLLALVLLDAVGDELGALGFGHGGDSEEAVVACVDSGVGDELGEHFVAAAYVVVAGVAGLDALHGGVVVDLGEVVVLELLVLHLAHAEGGEGLLSLVGGGGGDGEAVVVAGLARLLGAEVHLALGEVDLVAVFFVFFVVEEVIELALEACDVGMLEVGAGGFAELGVELHDVGGIVAEDLMVVLGGDGAAVEVAVDLGEDEGEARLGLAVGGGVDGLMDVFDGLFVLLLREGGFDHGHVELVALRA